MPHGIKREKGFDLPVSALCGDALLVTRQRKNGVPNRRNSDCIGPAERSAKAIINEG
jgi:hypothetical protein